METVQNESLETELSAISTILPSTQVELEKPDSLPRGSELSLRTIRLLASEILKSQVTEAVAQDVRVIIQEVDELLGRIEKRRLAKQQQAA